MASFWLSVLDRYFPSYSHQLRTEQFQSLIGSPEQQRTLAPGQTPRGSMTNTASGLLGGEYTPEQFWAKTAGLGGRYADYGTNALMNMQMQDARLRQQQEQYMHGFNNVSAYQDATLQQDQAQYDQTFAEGVRRDNRDFAEGVRQWGAEYALDQQVGNQGNLITQANQLADDLAKRSETLAKNIAPYQRVLRAAENVREFFKVNGINHNSTPADMELITAYVKALRPNEAVMSDDVQGVLQGMAQSDELSNFLLGIFNSRGTLGPELRTQLVEVINRQAQSAVEQIGYAAQNADAISGTFYGRGVSDTMRGPTSFNPIMLGGNNPNVPLVGQQKTPDLVPLNPGGGRTPASNLPPGNSRYRRRQ